MTDLTMFDNFEKIFCYQYPGVFNNLSLHPQVGEDAGIELYDKYKELADKEENVIFGGRLGMYQYFDMWKVIEEALKLVETLE